MPSTWQPILTGQEAARAEAAIDDIARALAERPAFPENDPFGASLATGETGLGLFFSYLSQARPGAGYDDLAAERLERAIDRLTASFHVPGLYQGFVSIAWAIEHLRDREDEDDPNEEIDGAVFELLGQTPWHGGFDLVAGLAGLGVYALERLPGASDGRIAEACLARVCQRLEELAVPQDTGVAWPVDQGSLFPFERDRFPPGTVNMGVSHGLPGVLPVLAQALAAGAAPEGTRGLLREAVAYLLSHKRPSGSGSVFPDAWVPGKEQHSTPTAWCYGDLGIAAALRVTARAAGEPAWEAEALDLARAVARHSSGVHDACLCHGAAGNGHVFNRLYQETGDPELLAAARAWMERALDLREPGQGIAGFLTWEPGAGGEMGWHPNPSVLTGVAGIGLALLAAVAPFEPAWDRFLVLSPAIGTNTKGTILP